MESSKHSKPQMDDNIETHLNLSLDALLRAVSDTEKLSALFVVAKALHNKTLDSKQYYQLFKTIDLTFLSKLLSIDENSEDIPDGCDPYIYQSIAFSIIASFYMTIGDQIESQISAQFLTSMTNIFEKLKAKNSLNDIETQLIDDFIVCLDSFFTFAANKESERQFVEYIIRERKLMAMLLELNESKCYKHENIINLLTKIASSYSWSSLDLNSFNIFMNLMAKTFFQSQDRLKFELCAQINAYLKHNTIDCYNINELNWIRLISDGLFSILASRLNKSLRDPALTLSATLTQLFHGFKWIFINEWNEKSAKFFALLVRLSCVEVAVGLDSQNIDMACVSNCFVLIEYAIITMANDCDESKLLQHFSSEQLLNLLTAVKESMFVVIDYIKSMSNQRIELDLNSDIYTSVLASIRILCVWMAEETEAYRQEICDVLPFIMEIARQTQNTNCSLNCVIIPALNSLIENDEIKSILKQQNIINFIDQCIIDSRNEQLINDLCKNIKKLLQE